MGNYGFHFIRWENEVFSIEKQTWFSQKIRVSLQIILGSYTPKQKPSVYTFGFFFKKFFPIMKGVRHSTLLEKIPV